MKRIRVYVKCEAVLPVLIDVNDDETEEEAIEDLEEKFIQAPDFWAVFREDCNLDEPTIDRYEPVNG